MGHQRSLVKWAIALSVVAVAWPAAAQAQALADPAPVFQRSFSANAWLPVPSAWNFEHERHAREDAQRGDPGAAFLLGLVEGWVPWPGQSRDHRDEAAVAWFEKASAGGNAHAQYMLAAARALGKGGRQDWREAATHLAAAAQQNHPWALAALAALHAQGLGVKADAAAARRLYQRAADLGNASAMARLGAMLLDGRGGPKDPVRARHLLEAAAEQGEPEGQLALGRLLGQTPATLAQSTRWLSLAAEAGQIEAQLAIAARYTDGRQVKRDPGVAATYLDMAARAGSAEAAVRLAGHFAAGDGVARSDAGAVQWLRRAADAGHARARFELAARQESGQGTPRDGVAAYVGYALAEQQGVTAAGAALARLDKAMAPAALSAARLRVAQVLEAAETAAGAAAVRYDQAGRALDPASLRWYRLAAESGSPEQQYQLGLKLLPRGIGPRDRREAMGWFRRALRAGHVEAGRAYLRHLHPESDLSEELALITAAAESGDVKLQGDLGRAYMRGQNGLPQHAETGEQWLARAARAGSDSAAVDLAGHFLRTRRDGAEGLKWLLVAAELGDARAQDEIGQLYEAGRLVPQDLAGAYMWYTIAADQAFGVAIGHQQALAPRLPAEARQTAAQEAAAWLARWKQAHPNGPKVKRLYSPVPPAPPKIR